MLRNFHFIKNKKVTLFILATVILIGIGSFIFRGFNIDIDFSGGSEIKLNIGQEVTNEISNQINDIIANDIGKKYVSSTKASVSDNNTAIIRTGTNPLSLEQQQTLITSLEEAFPDADFDDKEIITISPSIGSELKKTAIIAVCVAVVLMLIYIAIRFKPISGVAAILSLIHDLFVMLTVYSLLQIPINVNIIAALLTILGYSINATIIIFDRVRENRASSGEQDSFDDIVDQSIHQTLTRSINTTITTLFTIGMVYIFGVDSIKNFALPLIVGIVAGLFSSIFLSGLIWAQGEKLFGRKAK